MVPSGPLGITVLWHDPACLVINKPCGLSTQAPGAIDCVEARIRSWLAQRSAPGETPYLGIPHRLDRCTSGVMIFGLRRRVTHKLSKQFERREIVKQYMALVAGHVLPSHGSWRDFMRKVPDEPRAELVTESEAGAKVAELDYDVLAHRDGYSWIQLKPRTGRMHQIRLQAASRGHAILGDELYGSQIPFGPVVADPREHGIALHAVTLSYCHPVTRETATVTAPLPTDWAPYTSPQKGNSPDSLPTAASES